MVKQKIGVHINVFRNFRESLASAMEYNGVDASNLTDPYNLEQQAKLLGFVDKVTETLDGELIKETAMDQLSMFHADHIHQIYRNAGKTHQKMTEWLNSLSQYGDVTIFATQNYPFTVANLLWLSKAVEFEPSYNKLRVELGMDDPSRDFNLLISDNADHLDEGSNDILFLHSKDTESAMADKFNTASSLGEVLDIIKSLE